MPRQESLETWGPSLIPLESGQVSKSRLVGEGADLAFSSGQGWARHHRGERRFCDPDRFITSPHFNANAAAGFSLSELGQSHARPRLLCLLQVWIHSSCTAGSSLRVSAEGRGNPPAAGTCWSQDPQTRYLQPVGCPGRAGTWPTAWRKPCLESPLNWGRGIKFCSDTEVLQNSENGGGGVCVKRLL